VGISRASKSGYHTPRYCGQNTKGLCSGPTPSRPKWAGSGGGDEMEGLKSDPHSVENMKKRNQKYCILVIFKLADCTSNNTYGELRFNILYLELWQFVGEGQLGKALAYCF